MKKAFTLAEIMIVLTIIGVITAILLPVALQSAPDENIMKLKKGNNTLGSVIRELVNSDKYYANGDLGIRANGNLVDGTHDGDETYFCETFADIVTIKEKNCSKDKTSYSNSASNRISYVDIGLQELNSYQEDTPTTAAPKLDEACKLRAEIVGAEIVTADDIVFYSAVPFHLYGMTWSQVHSSNSSNIKTCEEASPEVAGACSGRFFNGVHRDINGLDRLYKTFCMDIDGIGKGEDPFGYGIRADGKIIPGARAQQWLQKTIQQGE